jgi:hypothetical protein
MILVVESLPRAIVAQLFWDTPDIVNPGVEPVAFTMFVDKAKFYSKETFQKIAMNGIADILSYLTSSEQLDTLALLSDILLPRKWKVSTVLEQCLRDFAEETRNTSFLPGALALRRSSLGTITVHVPSITTSRMDSPSLSLFLKKRNTTVN